MINPKIYVLARDSEDIAPRLPYVFVSYAELDGGDLAEAIKDYFEKWEYGVFVARRDIPFGEKWKKVIAARLEACQIFIVIATLGAIKSAYVDYEVQEAKLADKRIIPCRPDGVEWKDLKWDLGEYQGVPSFRTTEELLRKLGLQVLKNVGDIQGINLPFTIKTNKASYSTREQIEVTGTVPAIIQGVPVAVQFFNPRNTMYTIDQVTPNANGTYSTTVEVGGKLGIDGIYTVRAMYSGQSVQTTFEFTGAKAQEARILRAQFEDDVWNVEVSLTNGRVNGIKVDPDFTSIIISVNATSDGELTITIPRKLLDARFDGCAGDDDEFIILVDGEEETYDETDTTGTDRTLVVPVPGGAREVEIIGTCITPREKKQENVVVVMISEGASSSSNPRFYVPKEVRISRGTKVIWVNADSAGHTVTSGAPGDSDFGSKFDSTVDPSGFLIKARATFEHAFDGVGEFPYFCQVHPYEVGKIIVED